jgi:hypothetical protein
VTSLRRHVACCNKRWLGFDAAHDQSRVRIRALSLLARTEGRLGDLGAAQASADRAEFEVRSALAGFDHSEWLGSGLAAKALVHQARGEALEARRLRQEALEQLQATLGDRAPATVELRRELAASPSSCGPRSRPLSAGKKSQAAFFRGPDSA